MTIVGGQPVYTPPPGFSGTTTFTYTATDSAGQTATATVTVTVPAAPHAAHARDDPQACTQGQPVTVHPMHNDTPSTGAHWNTTTLRLLNPANGHRVTKLGRPRRGHVAGRRWWDRDVHPGGRVHRRPETAIRCGTPTTTWSTRGSSSTIRPSPAAAVASSLRRVVEPPPTSDPDPGTLPHTGATDLPASLWNGLRRGYHRHVLPVPGSWRLAPTATQAARNRLAFRACRTRSQSSPTRRRLSAEVPRQGARHPRGAGASGHRRDLRTPKASTSIPRQSLPRCASGDP